MSILPAVLSSDIKKPTALVHFERDLSPIEQKIMTLIIFHCQMSVKDDKGFYYIKKSLIREFIGWEDSKNYTGIYDGFEGIYNNSIQWNMLGADRTFEDLKCRLIVSLLKPTQTGQYVGFQLHHELEPLIRDPRVFARLKLIMLVLLAKPKYCYPLYELIADAFSRNKHLVKLSLSLLKEYLGIPADSYGVFKDFKTRVLKPSVDGINQFSDFAVSYKTYRDGRSIGGVIFEIRKQSWQPPQILGPVKELQRYYSLNPEALQSQVTLLPEEQAFVKSVVVHNVVEADARAALEIHGLTGAIEVRDYVLAEVERRKAGNNRVRDVGAYMVRCFREGFGKRTDEERVQEEKKQVADEIKRQQTEITEQLRTEFEVVRSEFMNHQNGLIESLLETMSDDERTALDRRFTRRNPIWAKKYREVGLGTPLVRAAFYKFAAEELLTDEQRDACLFARNKGVSIQVINMLESLGG